MPAYIVGIGIMAASTGLSIYGASQSNKAQKKQVEAYNRRSLAAAQATRDVNIPMQRYEAAVARQKTSRDSSLLLGQLVVSAAERNVLDSGSTESGINALVQSMSNNLQVINMNRYFSEQQILAATQYPTIQQYTPQNVGLAGAQGALSGLSMGLGVAGGMSDLGLINKARWGLT